MVSKSGNSFSCRDGALFSSAFHGIPPVLPKDHNAPKRNTAPSCLAFAAPRHSLQNHAEGFHQLHDTSRQTYDAAVLPDAYHHQMGTVKLILRHHFLQLLIDLLFQIQRNTAVFRIHADLQKACFHISGKLFIVQQHPKCCIQLHSSSCSSVRMLSASLL